jgi:hypothetical protein
VRMTHEETVLVFFSSGTADWSEAFCWSEARDDVRKWYYHEQHQSYVAVHWLCQLCETRYYINDGRLLFRPSVRPTFAVQCSPSRNRFLGGKTDGPSNRGFDCYTQRASTERTV